MTGYKYRFIYRLEDGAMGNVFITSPIKDSDKVIDIFKGLKLNQNWFRINYEGYER